MARFSTDPWDLGSATSAPAKRAAIRSPERSGAIALLGAYPRRARVSTDGSFPAVRGTESEEAGQR
jgi:hypothetical protein